MNTSRREKIFKLMLSVGNWEHILFLFLGILAVFFFKERLYADSSYYVFRLIDNSSFWVEHSRFILVFSQLLPLLGVKLGLSLKSVLILYSVGHILFFYTIYLVSRYYLKHEYTGLLLLLLQTMGIMSGFFVPMFELYYSAGFIVLFASMLYSKPGWPGMFIMGILSFFIFTAHPYSWFLYFLVLALHALEYRLKYIKHYIFFLLIFAGVLVYKRNNTSEYEAAATANFFNNLGNAVYDIGYLKLLVKFMLKQYKALLLLGLVILVLLLYAKAYFRALISLVFFLGTLAVINIAYYYHFDHSRYQEQVYFPLSFLVAYPFAMYLRDHARDIKLWLLSALAVMIIIVRIGGIIGDSSNYTGRLDEMKGLIEECRSIPGTKFVQKESLLKYDPNWSYPIETMLFSSIRGEGSLTICSDRDMEHDDNSLKLGPYTYLFRRWEIYKVESLNHRYFRLDNSDYSFLPE